MSSIEDRWKEDAKWYKEDARKNPEKYIPKGKEEEVTTEELNKCIENFIREYGTYVKQYEELGYSIVPETIKKLLSTSESEREERRRFNEWKRSLKPFIIK